MVVSILGLFAFVLPGHTLLLREPHGLKPFADWTAHDGGQDAQALLQPASPRLAWRLSTVGTEEERGLHQVHFHLNVVSAKTYDVVYEARVWTREQSHIVPEGELELGQEYVRA